MREALARQSALIRRTLRAFPYAKLYNTRLAADIKKKRSALRAELKEKKKRLHNEINRREEKLREDLRALRK